MEESPHRRRLLKQLGILGGAALPAQALAHASGVHASVAPPDSPLSAGTYLFFTRWEAAFIDAALSRLIPNDELGPGAVEAGVTYFIDRQLAGAWGAHAHNYRQGPWPQGTPEQGFQSPLTPQEIYRAAIVDIDRYCVRDLGAAFAEISGDAQERVLHDLQAGRTALPAFSSSMFFEMLWTNAQEGFFSDPMYGGNVGKAGWELVGFPGVAAAYTDLVEKHNEPYRAVPVSIADVRQGRVQLDEHGHPVHVLLSGKDG